MNKRLTRSVRFACQTDEGTHEETESHGETDRSTKTDSRRMGGETDGRTHRQTEKYKH